MLNLRDGKAIKRGAWGRRSLAGYIGRVQRGGEAAGRLVGIPARESVHHNGGRGRACGSMPGVRHGTKDMAAFEFLRARVSSARTGTAGENPGGAH